MRRNIRDKEPPVPVQRHRTVRQAIREALDAGLPMTARELSAEAGVREREVYEHLDHIRRSSGKKGPALVLIPAECNKCGFVFIKRKRLTRPGRCPTCRKESITEPLFTFK